MIHLPRFMLAAPSSGSGKTMITCGILQALKKRGLNPASFKCGPDYIDPMFHSKVIGAKSRNLDTFFADERTVRYLFARTASQERRTSQGETERSDARKQQVPLQGGFLDPGISVFEGVMGIYDGLGGTSAKASSYDLASVTDTPVILVVNARGMSLSVIPLIRGYVDYQKQLGKEVIRGVILNQTTKMTCMLLKEQIEAQTGVRVYGYVPRLADCVVESRHLGLVTPDEIRDLQQRIERLGEELEQCLDMEGILNLADEAEDYQDEELQIPEAAAKFCRDSRTTKEEYRQDSTEGFRREFEMTEKEFCEDAEPDPFFSEESGGSPAVCVRIAVATDEAFCFYYQDNLDLLAMMGAEIVPFSPLHDRELPEQISGLILGGGYPELYAKALSENMAMREQIRNRISKGMPYLAECGGFMYLHETMEDMEGNAYPMCGCVEGKAYRTPRLSRFGYVTLEPGENAGDVSRGKQKPGENADEDAVQSGMFLAEGQTIRAHEFHYFDSTNPGSSCTAKKPAGRRQWTCIHGTEQGMAGYPHLYYWSNPEFAYRFVCRAAAFKPEV